LIAARARRRLRPPRHPAGAGNIHRKEPFMTVKLYGIPKSRAFRCLWAAEEAGVPYDLVATDFTSGVKSPAFAALNPNAKIPAMQDGGLAMWESLAINLHLIRKGQPSLIPPGDGLSQVEMWTLWTATEIEPNQMQWAYNTFMRAPDQRDPKAAEAGAAALRARLEVLERVLADRDFLLGSSFTAADLNVACVLYGAWFNKFDLAAFPKVKAWLERCLTRPAAMKARAMREAA
jgi:glutathione S-transferase